MLRPFDVLSSAEVLCRERCNEGLTLAREPVRHPGSLELLELLVENRIEKLAQPHSIQDHSRRPRSVPPPAPLWDGERHDQRLLGRRDEANPIVPELQNDVRRLGPPRELDSALAQDDREPRTAICEVAPDDYVDSAVAVGPCGMVALIARGRSVGDKLEPSG
jgi:hypothetical protein